VSATDTLQISAAKGLFVGGVNLIVAIAMGAEIPRVHVLMISAVLGLLSYGVSLSLFVHFGTLERPGQARISLWLRSLG
jgi:hypothetical protein